MAPSGLVRNSLLKEQNMKLKRFTTIGTIALVVTACGSTSTGREKNIDEQPDLNQPRETSTPDLPGMMMVTVEGGFGSGRYNPGDTVYVWSAASTTKHVALPWEGDAALLKHPKEWISSFLMPSRNVVLKAKYIEQEFKLTEESFKGATTRFKSVKFHFPANPKGLVFMNHGTGGASSYIEGPEALVIAKALVHRGFAVLSTEAEESVAGDLNGDGNQRWDTSFTIDNTDLKNLSALLSSLENRKMIDSSTPLFALGMSNGGAFSHFLGALSSSKIATAFPRLRFHAVASYCADAKQIHRTSSTKTPSAWYMCGQDDHKQVSIAEAKENAKRLNAAGVQTEYRENPPTPVYDERFMRIDGISSETSKAIAKEIRSGGFVDPKGFLNQNGDKIAATLNSPQNAAKFPTIAGLSEVTKNRIRQQLKVMRAEHAQFSDLCMQNISFFEKFL